MKTYRSVLLTSVLAMSVVTAAHAGSTVRLEGTNPSTGINVVYDGDDGVNNVKVSLELFAVNGASPEGYYVEDKSGITAGPGCIQHKPTIAICGGGMPAKVIANLKGGNDIFTAVPFQAPGFSGKDSILDIRGGLGDDTISGNENNDVLNGEAGNDTINGHGGNDQVIGGSGNDKLHGDEGDDVILGGGGQDDISGGPGKDKINAGSGNDISRTGDNEADDVQCGKGVDRVIIGQDIATDVVNPDCEDLIT